jgi:hypothetical protein
MPYDLKLVDVGRSKIETIKALRSAFAPMGLFEAKTIADSAPVIIASNVPTAEIARIRKFFDQVARVEVSHREVDETKMESVSQGYEVTVDTPSGIAWVSLSDLRSGEIVSAVCPTKTSRSDLRIVTDKGAFTLDGKIAATDETYAYYQRLPAGTRVTFTIS